MDLLLEERIGLFVQAADRVTADYWQRNQFTHAASPTHKAEFISDKWCRVMVVEDGEARSVHSFVCLQDGQTKTLGILKKGDIHKAASCKAPAKRARGNVFSDDMEKCLTPHGIVYLK